MKRFLPAFQEALSFLTILPVRSVQHSPEEAPDRISEAMAWFPVVGAVLGAAGAWIAGAAHSFWMPAVTTLLGLTAVVAGTGGLHWDGFCDAVDGLAARKPPERTLEIMRDSRIGALGAAAAILMMALQWALLQSIPSHRLLGGWVAAGALSRWAMVYSATFFPYVPGRSGLGRLATDRKSRLSLICATVLGIGFAVCGLGAERAGMALGIAALGAWGMNRLFCSRVGGITGDTMGAVCVMTETLVLFTAAAR
ncbi:MAG: adenosylcobinamide-GDP ribazoletransferase [Candidatus Omnitrophica bacterium]|nr:adenosylcobinamide-GDP ribazoletransferase [Candidatus Omnitrophota bacterium]